MNNPLSHHHDHASVLLEGDLEWSSVHNLVHAIEIAVEYYHYNLVELRVRSLGGSNEALECLLERLRVWREAGVRFRTRAVGRTSSASALLVAVGDERVADNGVTLRFHGARFQRHGDMSAEESAAIHAKLSRANERAVERLVDRALGGAHVPGEHGAADADRVVVDGLCMGAGQDPAGTAPARVQTLASALGQTIDVAIAERDRSSLGHIYARLFQLDRPISGKLARTLAWSIAWAGRAPIHPARSSAPASRRRRSPPRRATSPRRPCSVMSSSWATIPAPRPAFVWLHWSPHLPEPPKARLGPSSSSILTPSSAPFSARLLWTGFRFLTRIGS
ncbi:MAG: hypothetical protein OXC01_11735 [Immundisolibacterales bacterium]|nr:hypothetical protein [Immundisolibacterales bacterium]